MTVEIQAPHKASYPATLVTGGIPSSKEDILAEEGPLQIQINDKPFIITMRTPGSDLDLAAGFLFSEGIITAEGLRQARITTTQHEGLDRLSIDVPEIFVCENLRPSRAIISYASCGICGSEAIPELDGEPLQVSQPFPMALLPDMYKTFQSQQTLFQSTGGCHAAGLFSRQGKLLAVREDVGRHNAVDKCVGALIESKELEQVGVLLVSGRISFEIMVKAYQASCPVVVAISAVSSLAVDVAQQFGMTVIGYCREDRATIYSHPEQVQL